MGIDGSVPLGFARIKHQRRHNQCLGMAETSEKPLGSQEGVGTERQCFESLREDRS